MKKLIIISIMAVMILTGCKGGLTKESTAVVLKAWHARTDEQNRAIKQKVYSDIEVKSMKERDIEVTKLLEEGAKK